jgi:hypothetical protein
LIIYHLVGDIIVLCMWWYAKVPVVEIALGENIPKFCDFGYENIPSEKPCLDVPVILEPTNIEYTI